MALTDEVTSRIPAQKLIEATNADISATTTDTAILALAATDVEADFKTYANSAYDGTDAQHVSHAIDGVWLKLLAYKRESQAIKNYQEWQERLFDRLRLQGHNNRLKPSGSSKLDPTPTADNAKPLFDANADFIDIIPERRGHRGSTFPDSSRP